jgi:hypothetical protein
MSDSLERDDNDDKNDESSTNLDTSFSCADCEKEFKPSDGLVEHKSNRNKFIREK